jgi:molybdate transport system ATP-binding protein
VREAVLDIDVELTRPRGPSFAAKFGCARGVSVLFGPSGAGKSTCLALVSGAERPTKGTLRFADETIVDVAARVFTPARRRRFALVPQSLALFPHMTARENVAYGIRNAGAAKGAAAWLDRLHVAQVADRRPSTFSGGEAQRVALARALASEPRVLLLDEPFSALDSDLRDEVGADLLSLVGELGIVTILVTHDRAEARRLGTWVIRLEAGKVTAEGPPEDVLGGRPREPSSETASGLP